MLAKSVGVMLTKINQKTLKETLIPLPPLSEQSRIVEIVERAEVLGKKRSEVDAKVDSILSALFIKMFGDPATNPMEWDAVELGKLLKTPLRTGLRVGKENYVDRNSENAIEIVRGADLHGEMLQRGNLKRVALTEREIERYLVNEDNLLMQKISRPDKAATPFRVPSSQETLVFDSNVIRIDINLEKIKPLYLYYYLVNPRTPMPYFHGYMLQLKSLENILVLLPPIEKQNNFIELVSKIETICYQQITSKNKLEALFKSLLHRAFAGELTARWRESHEKKLLAEMEEQAKLLSLPISRSNQ
jgi:type I restriction enzyme S subunit